MISSPVGSSVTARFAYGCTARCSVRKLVHVIVAFRLSKLCACFLDDKQSGWELRDIEFRIRVHGKVLSEKACPSHCCFSVAITVRIFF